jgi:N-carbamoyl-L-amino-acid hydrolase
VIAAGDLAERLAALDAIGAGPRGWNRLAWTGEDAAAGAWFRAQADAAGLIVERDPAGSLWAVPDVPGPWWGAGSHLDTVRDGGRFDGALGVAAAFAVAARSSVPVCVVAFADEEGARFNTPTFGSRALVGRLDAEDALARVDDGGVSLAGAMRAAGVDPAGLVTAPSWLPRLRGFLELHIDQSRAVAALGVPAAVVSSLATRLRLELTLDGAADHAGTTPRAERRDALLAAARLIAAADELGAGIDGLVSTATRIVVEPNALTAIPGRVRLWMDARAADPRAVDAFHAGVERLAGELHPVAATVGVASRSAGVAFDQRIRAALRDGVARAATSPGSATGGTGEADSPAPEVVCFAGHDAGIVGERIPAGMVLVRNARGVSHAPDEHVELDDAAVGATILLNTLEELR